MEKDEFLKRIQENAERVKRYQSGGDGSDGGCDCIGLIIGALRMAGVRWPWTHGSNYAARNRMRWLSQLDGAHQLQWGQLVFKAKAPGDAGYALPDTYRDHADRLDYYHVGVVTNTDPVTIANCTTVDGGMEYDRTLDGGTWTHYGELDLVEYSEAADEKILQVTSADGNPVKLRKEPGTEAVWIDRIAAGTQVRLLAWVDDVWARVEVQEKQGYMMRAFLREGTAERQQATPDGVSFTLDQDTVQKLRAALQEGAENGMEVNVMFTWKVQNITNK